MRRAIGATISTAGNATIQLEYHARNHVAGRSPDSPTAEIVETPEIIVDMIIDKKNPNTNGAKRAGITRLPLIRHKTIQSTAYTLLALQWICAISPHADDRVRYRGTDR